MKMGCIQRCFLVILTTLIVCLVDSRVLRFTSSAGLAGNVKLVAMNGNQYWFSSSSPYAPTLNFHLAYQYCRTLGLQLAVLETTEEVESISAFLNKDSSANQLSHQRYWTSANRLGADTWIWMSTGEQLNSSFADYWLKNVGALSTSSDNPRHCMSMKPPISPLTKRAIFTAEECNKSLPFICEQVRCLYYNYPVMLFPDPSELRTDIDEGTQSPSADAEARTSVQVSTSEKVESHNIISEKRRHNKKFISDFIAEESGRVIESPKIQRRMTFRPVMPVYPMPSNFDNSFFMEKLNNDTTESSSSTALPFGKKKPRDIVWTPASKDSKNEKKESTTVRSNSISNLISRLRDKGSSPPFSWRKPITQSSTNHKSLNVTVTKATVPASSSTLFPRMKKPTWSKLSSNPPSNNLKTTNPSKSSTVSDDEAAEAEDLVSPTMLYHRYGTGNSPSDSDQIFASGYVTTDSSIFDDDEENNVGGEVDIEEGYQETRGIPRYFQGSGVRRPDMTIQTSSTENTNKKTSALIADTHSSTEKMPLGVRLKLRLRQSN